MLVMLAQKGEIDAEIGVGMLQAQRGSVRDWSLQCVKRGQAV